MSTDLDAWFTRAPERFVDGVPSFVRGEHYAHNFAVQWQRYRDTQLDSRNGTSISRDFLEHILGAPLPSLVGKRVLEVGAGAGRFTEHLVRHAAVVLATDLSEAIVHNAARGAENLVVAQADLFDMPLQQRFDLVLCRGVLQHTPSPTAAIVALHGHVTDAGVVVFDIYGKGRLGAGRLRPKYLWRPVIQRTFTFDGFDRFLQRHAEGLLRARWRLTPFLPGRLARLLDYAIPVWDYRGKLPLDDARLVEWARLDTLDAMLARYDNAMSHDEVARFLAQQGLRLRSSDPSWNFFRSSLHP
jgi:SAM-dependent methyltransferase